jgi:hypothetical protein
MPCCIPTAQLTASNARELDQDAVARGLDHAPSVLWRNYRRARSYLLRNGKVKAQIKKPLRKEIVE